MPLAPGSLKCVIAWSAQRALRDPIEEALRAHVSAENIRNIDAATFLVYTDAEPADVRDWLTPHLQDGEPIFVVEFERWSGYGPAVDRDWLLRRGH